MSDYIQKSVGNISLFLLIFCICSCSEKQKNKSKPENEKVISHSSGLIDLDYINDFESNKSKFKKKSYPLDDFSTEGGELTIFHFGEKEYQVFDFWLYGETGKLNYTYWIDKQFQFNFAKRTKYVYDRPYYEQGFKIDTITHYISYEEPLNILFDKNRIEIKSIEEMESIKIDLESFFNDLTSEIEIPK